MTSDEAAAVAATEAAAEDPAAERWEEGDAEAAGARLYLSCWA